MKTFNIRFLRDEDRKAFVDIVSKYDCDIDISNGRGTVDAKSILGVISLDYSLPLTVTVNGDEKDILSVREALKDFVL